MRSIGGISKKISVPKCQLSAGAKKAGRDAALKRD
jgi:hypothetical protein